MVLENSKRIALYSCSTLYLPFRSVKYSSEAFRSVPVRSVP